MYIVLQYNVKTASHQNSNLKVISGEKKRKKKRASTMCCRINQSNSKYVELLTNDEYNRLYSIFIKRS